MQSGCTAAIELTVVFVRDLSLFRNTYAAAMLPDGAAIALDEKVASINDTGKCLDIRRAGILCLAA